jgi:DNA polymerase-3 subunit gamma/tau
VIESKAKDIPVKESRPKTTMNLGSILKGQPKEETKKEEKNGTHPKTDAHVNENQLRQIWSAYAELKKDQMAEYHLLNQPFVFKENIITLTLTNPIEEPILNSVKQDLLSYLREKLGNNSLQVEGHMQEQQQGKRIAYTNKEKFEHLAEKNPLLIELKERLGLDPDF